MYLCCISIGFNSKSPYSVKNHYLVLYLCCIDGAFMIFYELLLFGFSSLAKLSWVTKILKNTAVLRGIKSFLESWKPDIVLFAQALHNVFVVIKCPPHLPGDHWTSSRNISSWAMSTLFQVRASFSCFSLSLSSVPVLAEIMFNNLIIILLSLQYYLGNNAYMAPRKSR